MDLKNFVILAMAIYSATGSTATKLNLINQCSYGVTAYARHGSSSTNSYNLASGGGEQQLDVGSSYLLA